MHIHLRVRDRDVLLVKFKLYVLIIELFISIFERLIFQSKRFYLVLQDTARNTCHIIDRLFLVTFLKQAFRAIIGTGKRGFIFRLRRALPMREQPCSGRVMVPSG